MAPAILPFPDGRLPARRATNHYQRRKARSIAAQILQAAAIGHTRFEELPTLAARMSDDQWRTVAFTAGQPVPSLVERMLVVALLGTLSASGPTKSH